MYKEAILKDKRVFIQYYWSLLKKGDLILFSFIPNNDYNSMIIKISLFFFSFRLYYTINALFFTDSTMDKIYDDFGEYDFIYQIPKLLYTNLICSVINIIVKSLSLSERDILKIKLIKTKRRFQYRIKNILNCLNYKFVIYYLISYCFLVIFWFYVGTFCSVYKKTQIYLIKDTVISFSLSLLYPIGYYLLPGILRIFSLRSTKKNRHFIYKLSSILQLL